MFIPWKPVVAVAAAVAIGYGIYRYKTRPSSRSRSKSRKKAKTANRKKAKVVKTTKPMVVSPVTVTKPPMTAKTVAKARKNRQSAASVALTERQEAIARAYDAQAAAAFIDHSKMVTTRTTIESLEADIRDLSEVGSDRRTALRTAVWNQAIAEGNSMSAEQLDLSVQAVVDGLTIIRDNRLAATGDALRRLQV